MNAHDKPGEHDRNGAAERGGASSLTRRQWFLRLGEAAVLAGFSGVAEEGVLALDFQTPAADSQVGLPPGLYGPSPAHMAHALISDQRFVTPPLGSETEYAAPSPGPFGSAFFSREDFPKVRRLVRVMLNTGDASAMPAGIAAVGDETVDEIAQWIDMVLHQASAVRQAALGLSAQHRTLAAHYYGEEARVRQLENEDEQKTWNEGLSWLKAEAAKLSAQGFLSLTEAQQAGLLSSADLPSGQHPESAATLFYRALKRRTIEGYYTSQAGLEELDYQGNAFHAESPGCPQK